MDKRVAIVQSNYVPWRGYFDLIDRVDEFVLLDDRQYTRRDWRNRNRIKTQHGTQWLSIPVQVRGRYTQRIDETLVADPAWPRHHLDALKSSYARTAFWPELRPWLEELYEGCDEPRLSAVNRRFLEAVCALIGITTQLSWSTDYEVDGDRSERLVSLCGATGATSYVSGPTARSYLDVELFAEAGIDVEWMDYSGYREYEQPHGLFESSVTIIDLLLCVGPAAARDYMTRREHV